jgi:hypothetical protein
MFDDGMTLRLLVIAALAAFAAACGGVDRDPNLAAAAAKTEDTGSSRFELSGTITEEGQQLAVTCSGEADYEAKWLRFSCDYGGAGATEVIGLGTDTYMRGEVFGFAGAGEKWVRMAEDESFADEISPQRLLAMLRGASQTTERIGEERVRGDETVRYRLLVDCEQAELPECEGQRATVDVWIDDDGLVRRIAFQEGASPYTVEFFDFGAEVAIEAPAADDVMSFAEWTKPRSCRLDAGAPLTGADVAAALQRRGLEVGYGDACVANIVAIVEVRGSGAGNGAFSHCQVAQTEPSTPFTFQLAGMTSASAANVHCFVHCFYTAELAPAMNEVVADLERQARE